MVTQLLALPSHKAASREHLLLCDWEGQGAGWPCALVGAAAHAYTLLTCCGDDRQRQTLLCLLLATCAQQHAE